MHPFYQMGESDKSTQNCGKIIPFPLCKELTKRFAHFLWDSQNLCFVLPGVWETPSRGWCWHPPHKVTLWVSAISSSYGSYFNADGITSNICTTAKRQRKEKKRKERALFAKEKLTNLWRGKIHFRACEWESQTKVNLQNRKTYCISHWNLKKQKTSNLTVPF